MGGVEVPQAPRGVGRAWGGASPLHWWGGHPLSTGEMVWEGVVPTLLRNFFVFFVVENTIF